MKIRQLEVKNFRGFEHKTFHFSDQFNLLIGDNGTGKSSIIEALGVGASALLKGFKEVYLPPCPQEYFRCVEYIKEQILTLEPQYPLTVSCKGFIDGYGDIEWCSTMNGKSSDEYFALRDSYGTTRFMISVSPNIEKFAKKLQTRVNRGEDVVLPLIASFATDRLQKKPQREVIETLKPESRIIRGYDDCLESGVNPEPLLKWFKTMEISALQRKTSFKIMEAVKEAIQVCLEESGVRRISYDILADDLLIKFNDGRTLTFRMLSDGIRNMLAMVAGIAYRAAVLNPHLGTEVAKQTPGIILIDEIDLHLHPKWQRRVIEDLKRTFPKIQFFATTHSPFMIQSLREGELIDLNSLNNSPMAEYESKSIEEVAEYVMGVKEVQRSERYKKMKEVAKEYYTLLEEAKKADPKRLENLKAELDNLIEPYSDKVAYYAFLEMKRAAAGLGKD
jgi:predicted ATP-binding protein involved in virulence